MSSLPRLGWLKLVLSFGQNFCLSIRGTSRNLAFKETSTYSIFRLPNSDMLLLLLCLELVGFWSKLDRTAVPHYVQFEARVRHHAPTTIGMVHVKRKSGKQHVIRRVQQQEHCTCFRITSTALAKHSL